jgi:hypothetical protein
MAMSEGDVPERWRPDPTTEYIVRTEQPFEVIDGLYAGYAFAEHFNEDDDMRRRQVHSALVQAALEGSLTLDMAKAGMLPPINKIAPHTTMESAELDTLLHGLPTGWLVEACWRADSISNSEAEVPQRMRPLIPDVQKAGSNEEVPEIVDDGYVSWGDVCAYYQQSLAQPLGEQQNIPPSDPRKTWGAYYVKDLTRYPAFGDGPLLERERQRLEGQFIALNGVPYIDDPKDAEAILADLPPDVPAVCFLDNREILMRNADESQPIAKDVLSRQEVTLTNLLVLRSLRTAGAVGTTWLEEKTGYNPRRFNQGLDGVMNKLGEQTGVVARTKGGRNPHFRLQDIAYVADARPRNIS